MHFSSLVICGDSEHGPFLLGGEDTLSRNSRQWTQRLVFLVYYQVVISGSLIKQCSCGLQYVRVEVHCLDEMMKINPDEHDGSYEMLPGQTETTPVSAGLQRLQMF